jgi:hypothetical protein
MGLLNKVFGGDSLAKPIEAVGNIVDELFTSKEEKLTHEEVKMRLLQKPQIIQTEINKIEAQHRSIFVAGWRPFIGWVCGVALAYNFVLRDLLAWVILNTKASVTLPPALQMDHLMTVLLGMLGLGGLRTWEKFKGKTK